MKKILSLLVLALFFTIARANASTAEYFIDDNAVEAVLQNGVQVSADQLLESVQSFGITSETQLKADKSPAVAFVLSWLVGWLGIHRAYLGTAPGVIVGYILTCGGLGIVWAIDTLVLLISMVNDEGIEKYTDNPKFFMWSGGGGGASSN